MKYNYTEYALIFKSISDPTRIQILSMLIEKEFCACDILEKFNITQPTLSYHMKKLTEGGLVKATKDGSWVKYAIDEERKNELFNFLNILFENKNKGDN